MCSPSAPQDNTAEIARQEEEKRQARIAEGKGIIDNTFSTYNDDFYNQYQNDYTNYYTPQLENQYNDARDRLTLKLAKTGNINSSAGIDRFGDLDKYYDQERTGITNQALDAVNTFRSNVDTSKSNLYQDNRAVADPGQAASMAASTAKSLQPQMPTSPLADTFANFFNQIGQASSISGNVKQPYQQQTGVQTYGGGGSSGRVIGQ